MQLKCHQISLTLQPGSKEPRSCRPKLLAQLHSHLIVQLAVRSFVNGCAEFWSRRKVSLVRERSEVRAVGIHFDHDLASDFLRLALHLLVTLFLLRDNFIEPAHCLRSDEHQNWLQRFGHECTPLTAICMSAVFGVVIAQQLVKVLVDYSSQPIGHLIVCHQKGFCEGW